MGYRNRIYTLWVFELQNMHKSNTLIFPHQTILFLALRESHIRKQGKTQRVHHLALAFVQTRRIHSQNLSQNIRCMVRIQFGEYAKVPSDSSLGVVEWSGGLGLDSTVGIRVHWQIVT